MHFAYFKSVGFDRVLVTSCERVCGHNYARAYARYSRAPAPGGSRIMSLLFPPKPTGQILMGFSLGMGGLNKVWVLYQIERVV